MALSPADYVGIRVREVRKHKGWTQEQLAEQVSRLGGTMDRTAIAKIELRSRNQRRVSIDEVFQLAAALGVSPVALLLPQDTAPVRVAPQLDVGSAEAALWARGVTPLLEAAQDEGSLRFFYDETTTHVEANVLRSHPGVGDVYRAGNLVLRMAVDAVAARDLERSAPIWAGIRRLLENISEAAATEARAVARTMEGTE